MRRDTRKHEKSVSDKIIMYSMIGGVALTVILIGLLMYSKNLRDDVRQGTIDLGNMSNITNNTENIITTTLGNSNHLNLKFNPAIINPAKNIKPLNKTTCFVFFVY